MAYSKTVWNNNTPPDISAENLNKMEQGIADAQFPDGGSTGQILSKTNDGTGWIDAPNSAEWGNIEGQLSEQTDLYSELESKITMPSGGTTGQVLTKTASGQAWQDASGGGNVDTVNGISPNAQKNVEVDIELTKAEYDALPSSKESDGVNYWIKDGTNLPQTSVISADGVMYTDSQTVKGALDEQASAISDLNNGLSNIFRFVEVLPWGNYGTVGQTATLNRDITKAKMAMFEVGWNSAPNKSGLNCSLIPQMMLAVGSTITIPYVVGGVFSYVIVNITSATSITIVDSNNTNLGLRTIAGVF
jgi:hypothetical protein